MSLARSVGRNTIIQVIGKIAGTLIGFLAIAILQRSLGTEGFGAYTTVMAYVGFFSVIADLGLYMIVLREIAKPNADKERIVGNALAIRLVSAAVVLAACVAIAFFFPYSAEIRSGIAIIVVSFFFIAVQQLLVSLFQQALKTVWVVIGELLGRVVLVALVYWFSRHDATLAQMLLAVTAGTFANMLVVLLSGMRLVRLRLYFDKQYWKFILQETWPIALSIVLNLLYFRLDTVFLSIFRPLEEVGLYGAAYKILEILVSMPVMFVGLIMPILSMTAYVEPERFSSIFKKSFTLLLIAALPIVVGGMLLAKPLLVLIGGEAYAPASGYLRVLLFSIGAMFLNSLSGHTVTAINEQRRMVWGYFSVAMASIAAYLILIPLFGAYGAAFGTVFAQTSIMIVGYAMIKRRIGVAPSLKGLWKMLACTAVMAAVIWLFRGQHVLIAVVVAMLTYGGLVLATRLIDPTAMKEIIFPRRNDA